MSGLDTRPTAEGGDPYRHDQVVDVVRPLEALHRAGVLSPADVHGAVRLAAMTGDRDDDVLVGYAMALRAVRTGHVALDLVAGPQQVVATDPDVLRDLEWPPVAQQRGALQDARGVVQAHRRQGRAPGPEPFVLEGRLLYLRRYHDAQLAVLDEVTARLDAPDELLEPEDRAAIERLLPDPPGGTATEQRDAARRVLQRRLTVLAGGPGTGKTTCLGGVLGVLDERWRRRAGRPPRIVLAAPTGKAARRMGEALGDWLATADVTAATRTHVGALTPRTLHAVLGRRRGSTRARRGPDDPLPADVVVVDETSMADVVLLAQLLAATPRDARVVLVGDPAQLASVEAGSVLGDLVGPMADDPGARSSVSRIRDAVVVLRRTHRFDERLRIGRLAAAVRLGDVRVARDVLERAQQGGDDSVRWVPHDGATPAAMAAIRDDVLGAALRAHAAAERGDDGAALDAVSSVRVLAAHRRGRWGVDELNRQVQRWLEAEVRVDERVGLPLLVGRRHRREGIDNGDIGVVVRDVHDRPLVAFPGGRAIAPGRLEDAEVVHAMTIHKSQGSQFDEVVVVLPHEDSRLVARELLYTAITRARTRVTVVGTERMVTAAVTRRVERTSGIRRALWG